MLGWWGVARVAVCWGRYEWPGAVSCHSQWGAFAILAGAAAMFVVLIYEISELMIAEVEAEHALRRPRAAWRGYRALKGAEFVHVTTAALVLLSFLIGFAWLVFVSDVRF